jgi:hypothetical protein
VEDQSVAARLGKNALGGYIFCGVMTAFPLVSRYAGDGITVQVIFLGREKNRVGLEW